MKYTYGKIDWNSPERGEENCYLLTNKLGGFSSLSMTGSNARNDQALLMASFKAPTERYHMLTRLEEEIILDDVPYSLSGQRYVDHTKEKNGQQYLQSFVVDDLPVWIYQIGGVQIIKKLVLDHAGNTLSLRYEIDNRTRSTVSLQLKPLMQFVFKGALMPENQSFTLEKSQKEDKTLGTITSNGLALDFETNASVIEQNNEYISDLSYAQDSRDGRFPYGRAASNHILTLDIAPKTKEVLEITYSARTEKEEKPANLPSFINLYNMEKKRLSDLEKQAGLHHPAARQLVKAANQFIVDRESTGGKSIIAGYPFFGDWGRDTMIALPGCTLSTGLYEEAQNIFETFMKYTQKGLMPNMFPEKEQPPMYNTVDASLLFISSVYEYYLRTKDFAFVKKAWPVMKEIISWYQKGTDYDIYMDEDGLICAGSGLDQVTWMDVRFEDILPTPRHGKPVEINAYWYNDLKIMEIFASLLEEDGSEYLSLSEKVKESFIEKFWNEEKHCLKDFLAKDEPELSKEEQQRRKDAQSQIRCNQIWAVSARFGMLSKEQEKEVVDTVFEKLYTPRGLRSLSEDDKEFQPVYMGPWKHRDLSYHQGTVWTFPLGAYFLAYLKVNDYSNDAKEEVYAQLDGIEGAMREGCIGQLAEIYDGKNPVVSEGCFAQAWSTGELLRVYEALEKE
jgi:predicted glycogen debranching enzyme